LAVARCALHGRWKVSESERQQKGLERHKISLGLNVCTVQDKPARQLGRDVCKGRLELAAQVQRKALAEAAHAAVGRQQLRARIEQTARQSVAAQ
jgi:hypothetical protein